MVYLPCHPPKSGNTFLPHHHSLILRPWERVQTEAHYALYGLRMIVEFISNEMSKTLNPAQLKSAIAFVSALMKCPHSLWLNSILNSLYLVKLQPHIFFRSHLHNSNQQIGLRKFWGNNWNNFPLHKNKYMLTYRHNRWRALVSMSLLSPLEPVVSTYLRTNLKVLVGVAVNHISTVCVPHHQTVAHCPKPPLLAGFIPSWPSSSFDTLAGSTSCHLCRALSIKNIRAVRCSRASCVSTTSPPEKAARLTGLTSSHLNAFECTGGIGLKDNQLHRGVNSYIIHATGPFSMCQMSPKTTPFGAVAFVVMFLSNKIKASRHCWGRLRRRWQISQITMWLGHVLYYHMSHWFAHFLICSFRL